MCKESIMVKIGASKENVNQEKTEVE